MEVIEHLYQPRAFVLFIRSILEASGGGQFIVTTSYHGYLKNLTIAAANKMDHHLSALWEGGHIKFWCWVPRVNLQGWTDRKKVIFSAFTRSTPQAA